MTGWAMECAWHAIAKPAIVKMREGRGGARKREGASHYPPPPPTVHSFSLPLPSPTHIIYSVPLDSRPLSTLHHDKCSIYLLYASKEYARAMRSYPYDALPTWAS